LRIGLVGAGNVGGGVIELLRMNRDLIASRAGAPIEIVAAAARDVERAKSRHGDDLRWTTDWREIAAAEDVDVVVELMGGTGEARECLLAAIGAGKPVVTANKALLAERGDEIFARASEAGTCLMYEAAIAGAIPVVKALSESLAANRIASIVGILNGTCNYILTSMEKGEGSFEECLAKAQRLGFAEADPTLDVGGIDAAHKICLLGRLAMGTPLDFGKVIVRGIREIDSEDISFAGEMGYRVRLLAIAKRDENSGVELMVYPTLLPQGHIMAKVDGSMNAVQIASDAAGETICYGAGAGGLPTASAVVSDLIDIACGRGNVPGDAAPLCKIVPAPEVRAHSFYMRMSVADEPGVLSRVSGILAEEGISIGSVVQREGDGEEPVDLVMILHRNRFGCVLSSVERIGELGQVAGKVKVFPVETFA